MATIESYCRASSRTRVWGGAHRVSSMFEYPPAHDTYYEEQSEHHEEDESNEQVLLHEYDSGSDYDDAISIGYYSDDN
jgi:hypothetical protein